MLGRDYRLAHSLIDGCHDEMAAYKCVPHVGFEKSLEFHLSWVLLCLENGYNSYERDKKERKLENKASELVIFNETCLVEMVKHRGWLMNNLNMAPELVMDCANVCLLNFKNFECIKCEKKQKSLKIFLF